MYKIKFSRLENAWKRFLIFAYPPFKLTPFVQPAPGFVYFYQINWLNDYHEMCREQVGDLLHEQGKMAAYRWLLKETEPLG